jgi:hypothetical protein
MLVNPVNGKQISYCGVYLTCIENGTKASVTYYKELPMAILTIIVVSTTIGFIVGTAA